MPQFIYKVRDRHGQERQGTQEASNEEGLISRLQNEGLLVVSVTRQDLAKKRQLAKTRLRLRVTIDDLILFTRQLATLLEAGVTLLKSLDVLTKQVESRALLQIVRKVRDHIAEGGSFRDALAKHPQVFSEFWVHMVETGEASGALPLVLEQLAEHLESTAAMRRKVISALIYPLVLIALAAVALTIFTVWIIPIFSRVFDSFDVQLPVLTYIVVAFSTIMRRYFLVLLVMAVGLGYFAYNYIRTERGRWQLDWLKFKMPVLSSLFQRIAIERFTSGLGTLVESGVPILYSLDIMGKTSENKVMQKAIVELRESVRQGKGMARPLERSSVFTPMVVQMVSVGEEIGELGKMLKKISEFYQERISAILTRLTILIEPAILVFMGIVVGVMVVSMFLPIFQLAMVSRGG